MSPMDAKTHEINANLVANVKKHRVLYDNTVPEYAIKRYSKSAWEAISKVCGLTENECKFRWRNLRISFLRYNRTKKNSNAHVKPYYLQEDMAFMLPFISSRPSAGVAASKRKALLSQSKIKSSPSSKKYKYKHEEAEAPEEEQEVLKEPTDEECEDIQFEYLDENEEKQLILQKRDSPISIIQPENEEQNDPKENFYEIVSTTRRDDDNPDWNFLKSFIPDLQKMSPSQKIKFKLALCTAINDILYT